MSKGNQSLEDSIISNNSAVRGGGVFCARGSTGMINCRVIANRADTEGGGFLISTGGNVILMNSVLCGNQALEGGALYAAKHDDFTVLNCSLTLNRASRGRGMLCRSSSGRVKVENSIIADNSPSVYSSVSASLLIEYSHVLGGKSSIINAQGVLVWGSGNIDSDPLFVIPGYWDNNGTLDDPNDDIFVEGDYHLKSQAGRWDPNSKTWVIDDVTSPCIDAGDPNSLIGDEPFPNSCRINMGAYGGTMEASKSLLGASIYSDWYRIHGQLSFVPEQSTVIQTGGIFGVHLTYILTGQFRLTIDFETGHAWISHVEAIGVDDSVPERTLDPNDVFSLTTLEGALTCNGSIQFMGKTADESDILLNLTLSGDSIFLKGQTIPPANSADYFLFELDALAQIKSDGT